MVENTYNSVPQQKQQSSALWNTPVFAIVPCDVCGGSTQWHNTPCPKCFETGVYISNNGREILHTIHSKLHDETINSGHIAALRHMRKVMQSVDIAEDYSLIVGRYENFLVILNMGDMKVLPVFDVNP